MTEKACTSPMDEIASAPLAESKKEELDVMSEKAHDDDDDKDDKRVEDCADEGINEPDHSCNDTLSSDGTSTNECQDSITSLPSPDTKKRAPPGGGSFRKMNSTGHIEKTQNRKSNEISNEIIPPFRKISCNNHILETDLESGPKSDPKLLDSHTAYRRALESEITELKLQLVEAQSRADTLQNDFNKASSERDNYKHDLQVLTIQHNESKQQVQELSTVVTHLQTNAKESAEERATLSIRAEKSDSELSKLQARYRLLRFENRQTRKDLQQTQKDLEGKSMESQGLRSENDWLKRQIHRYDKNSGVISDHDDAVLESTDDENAQMNMNEMTEYLSKRGSLKKSNSKRRSRRSPRSSVSSSIADENVQGISMIEGIDPLSSYTSFVDGESRTSQSVINVEYSNPAGTFIKRPSTAKPNQFFSNLAKRHGMEMKDDNFDDNRGAEYQAERKSWLPGPLHNPLPTMPFGRKDKNRNEYEYEMEEKHFDASESERLETPIDSMVDHPKDTTEEPAKSPWWSFGFTSISSKQEAPIDDHSYGGKKGEHYINGNDSDSYNQNSYSSEEFLQTKMNTPNPQFLADDGAISVGNGTLLPKRLC